MKTIRCDLSLRCLKVLASGLAALALSATASADITLYADDFSGSSASNLTGTAPDTRPGTETWNANPLWKADGSVVSAAGGSNAFLPFTPQAGKIYTLSLGVTLTAGGENWFALGFTGSNAIGSADGFHHQGPAPWMLHRQSGKTVSVGGPGTPGVETTTTSTGLTNLKIILDTRSATWFAKFFRNDVFLGYFVYASNPTINYVGFGEWDTAGGSVDSFSLSAAEEGSIPYIPNPSFEEDAALFTTYPGYVAEGNPTNPSAIPGWVVSTKTGINPLHRK